MNKSTGIAVAVERIMELGPQMGGVFSSADLASMIAGGSDLNNQRMISRLVRTGIISRVLKGIYITKTADLWLLSARISEASYVSMDSALAKHGLIGSVPERSLSAIYRGRKKRFDTPCGSINFYSIAPEFFFGFSKLSSGINMADPEKAFIDILYFYAKGARFLIDPLNDVNVERLNKKKLFAYLKRYKNPKFIKFVKGVL